MNVMIYLWEFIKGGNQMKISSKLNELKPTDLNCNVFDVYSYDGLSMQDLLCQFFTKIKRLVNCKFTSHIYLFSDYFHVVFLTFSKECITFGKVCIY